MFDGIIYIDDCTAIIKLKTSENITINLIDLHLIFDDGEKKILGEVKDVNDGSITVNFLGEFIGEKFINGIIRKPKLDAKIRGINAEEFSLVTGTDKAGYVALGSTPFYSGLPIYLDANEFFSNHFALLGNDGFGKSYGFTSIVQSLFQSNKFDLTDSNFLIFDSTGEYRRAFDNINSINANYNYRNISFDESENVVVVKDKIRIPIYLLTSIDLALLLQINDYSQISMLEKMHQLAISFSQTTQEATNYKNYLIAKAIGKILHSNETIESKKMDVFAILSNFSTPQFNLEVSIKGGNETKKFRECFVIEKGKFRGSKLIESYISEFMNAKNSVFNDNGDIFYTVTSLRKAWEFLVISEDWLKKSSTYEDAIVIKTKLDVFMKSEYAKYFDVKDRVTSDDFIKSLFNKDEKKYQIVNISLEDISDKFGRIFIMIFSRMLFDYCKNLNGNNMTPFHLLIDNAHNYVNNDQTLLDEFNIFDKIVKDGRKYGLVLGIVGEVSSAIPKSIISQCSNFLLFRINHFEDINYLKQMIPSINEDVFDKVMSLQIGNCVSFGTAFSIPMLVKLNAPSPVPSRDSFNVSCYWNVDNEETVDGQQSNMDVESNENEPVMIISSSDSINNEVNTNSNDSNEKVISSDEESVADAAVSENEKDDTVEKNGVSDNVDNNEEDNEDAAVETATSESTESIDETSSTETTSNDEPMIIASEETTIPTENDEKRDAVEDKDEANDDRGVSDDSKQNDLESKKTEDVVEVEKKEQNKNMLIPEVVVPSALVDATDKPHVSLVNFNNKIPSIDVPIVSTPSTDSDISDNFGARSLVTFNNGDEALPMNNFDASSLMNNNENNSRDLSQDGGSSNDNDNYNDVERNYSDTFSISDLPDIDLGSGVTGKSGFLNLDQFNVVNAPAPTVSGVPRIPSNLTLAGSRTENMDSYDSDSPLSSFIDNM